ncbi:hypothetical protein [Tenacibaculum sp. nBUS_03]|uniref:hypothetical protein n=1 Tax=Tenacibaculum sp. nBUS_03 TaxID=3395320 RepID=UPI003EB7AB20
MSKTLFVFSDDFGELVLLRLLLYKQPLHAYLALPERLFPHVTLNNVTKVLYKNESELKAFTEEVLPDKVMLFSAYLLAPNGMLTYTEFYDFLDYLDRKNIPISTSDPFMRYYDELDYEVDSQDSFFRIRNKLKQIGERLKGYTHVYGVPVNLKNVKSQSFSNPNKLKDFTNAENITKTWTFVLAQQDYNLLRADSDNTYHKIIESVVILLTKVHNIKVNLVFPKALIAQIKQNLGELKGISYVPYCTLNEFEHLIVASDLMLYWNIFSASTLLCRLYNKPTVYLGMGHMEAFYPGFYSYIKHSWFPDNEPEIMAINDAFIPSLIKRIYTTDSKSKDPKLHQPYYQLESPIEILAVQKTFEL